MADNALSNLGTKISDWLSDQTWYQQLKAKWEELDSQSRLYLKIVAAAISALTVLIVLSVSWFGVRSQKKELADKNDLIHMIQSANDELRRLRDSNAALGGASADGQDPGPWSGYFEMQADNSGIDRTKLAVSPETPAPSAPGSNKNATAETTTKESLMDITLKKVNVKQLAKFAFFVENGGRPVKLRSLTVDAEADESGYLNATLAVSGFSFK